MSKIRVLFVSSNLLNPNEEAETRLSLEQDVWEVRDAVRQVSPHNRFELNVRWVAHKSDFYQALSDFRPHVVHFNGFSAQDRIFFETDEEVRSPFTDPELVDTLLEVNSVDTRVVVLSRCFSRPQADAIAAAVVCVIGTPPSISSRASSIFIITFYRALAFGVSIREAFEQASMTVAGNDDSAAAAPTMVANREVDPESFVLLPTDTLFGRPIEGVGTTLLDRAPAVEQIDASETRTVSPPPRRVRRRSSAGSLAREASPTTLGDSLAETSAGNASDHPDEAVPMHTDHPAVVDQLQRQPFAEVVGARINEVYAAQSASNAGGGAFMVHVHGPWGAGKTSVLNFLRTYLQDESRPQAQPWIVVDFNAWRHQRIRPPWWSLLREVYAQAAKQLGRRRSISLRLQWLWWRFRADWVPAAAAIVLIVVTVALTVGALSTLLVGSGAPPSPVHAGDSDAPAKDVELALKILTALFAAGGAVLAASRSLVFGSSSAAQTYASLRSDPLSPIVRLFKQVVSATKLPVAVFVDDLDRCDAGYVVELLEGIQTLFRSAPVTYVVAADRKWICSSFQKAYGDFGAAIGEPGRPLGYLFLDKIFQVSASVPRPSPEVRATYWTSLLRTDSNPEALDAARKAARTRASGKIGQARTQEELEARIAETVSDPHADFLDEQAMRAAAAQRITSPEARRQTEHRLQRFAPFMESNPRSMKRLVNAFGLHQATHFLEGRSVAADLLARWTIIELRWPLLADYLALHPEATPVLLQGSAPNDEPHDADLKTLFRDPSVLAVLRGNETEADPALDAPAIHAIVGDRTASPDTPVASPAEKVACST